MHGGVPGQRQAALASASDWRPSATRLRGTEAAPSSCRVVPPVVVPSSLRGQASCLFSRLGFLEEQPHLVITEWRERPALTLREGLGVFLWSGAGERDQRLVGCGSQLVWSSGAVMGHSCSSGAPLQRTLKSVCHEQGRYGRGLSGY